MYDPPPCSNLCSPCGPPLIVVFPYLFGCFVLYCIGVCAYIGVCGYIFLCIMGDDNFNVVFHHGGKFVNDGKLKYEGEVSRLSCGPDHWSYFEVMSILREMGYMGENELCYCVGGGSVLEDRSEILCDDRGAMNMVTLARLNGEVHLFVMHKMCEPEIIEMLEYFSHDGDVVEGGGNENNMADIMSEKENADSVPQPELVKEGLSSCQIDLYKGGQTVPEGDLDKGVESVHEADLDKGVESVHEADLDKGVQSVHEGDLNKRVESVHEGDLNKGVESVDEADLDKDGVELHAEHDNGGQCAIEVNDDSQVGTAGLVDINVETYVEDEHEQWVGNIEVEVGGIEEDFGGPSRN